MTNSSLLIKFNITLLLHVSNDVFLSEIMEKFLFPKTTLIIDNIDSIQLFNYIYPKIDFDSSQINTLMYDYFIDSYVIPYSSSVHLEGVLDVLQEHAFWNCEGRFLVIAKNETEIHKIFKLLWRYSICDILIVNIANTVEIFQMDYKHFDCNEPLVLKVKANEILEKSAMVIHKCNISVIWSYMEPYVMDPNSITDKGIFVTMLNTVAEADGLKISYLPRNEKYRLETTESGSYYNVLDDFNNETGQIYLAIVKLQYEVLEKFDLSVIICEDRFIWAVPNPEHVLNWKMILMILTYKQWVAFFCMFVAIVHVLKWYCTSSEIYFKKISNCYMYIYSLYISGSVNAPINSSRLRFYILCNLWPALLLDTYFQGRFYSVLFHPLHIGYLRNLDEIVMSDINIILPDDIALVFLFGNAKENSVYHRSKPSTKTLNEMLYDIVVHKDFATVINENLLITNPQFIGSFKSIDWYKYHIVILYKKGLVVKQRLNVLIIRLKEGGIIDKWKSDMQWGNYLQKINHLKEKETFQALNLTNMFGAFVILGFGSTIAIFIFMYELIKLSIIEIINCK